MIKNHIKTAWRTIFRNRLHAAINVIGLSLGITVVVLIGLWIWDELTFDQQSPHHERIAQVMVHTQQNGSVETSKTVAAPLAAVLRSQYSEDFKYVVLARQTGEHRIRFGDKILRTNGKFISKDGPNILPLEMLNGTRGGLNDPHSIMLSRSFAEALFTDVNPIGKTLTVDQNILVKVTGIYQDLPKNSSFAEVKYLLPWSLLTSSDPNYQKLEKSWEFNWFEVFVEVRPSSSISAATTKIKNLQQRLLKDNANLASYSPVLFLYPMAQWHLYGQWENGKNIGGLIKFVWLLATIGMFVLLLAVINFINLSTAQYEKRAKEVGIRKAIGSTLSQLISQFYSESALLTVISFGLAIGFVSLSLPFFNTLADKHLSVPYSHPYFWVITAGSIILLSLLAGSYPAFYLSSFKTAKVLKGSFKAGKKAALPRQGLVVFQYTVCTLIMIGTFIVYQQIQYAKNRPKGYCDERLISFQMSRFNGRNEAFRNDLLNTGVLEEVAQATSPATDIWSNTSGFHWEGKDPGFKDNFSLIAISPSYGKTMGWKIVAGRDFSRDFISDSTAIIINESAVNYMGIKNPIGKKVRWKDETFNDNEYTIVGVANDMVMQSPYESVHQTIYFMQPAANFLFARLKHGVDMQQALTTVKAIFKKHAPNEVFDYVFVEDAYADKFAVEDRIGKLAGIFTVLTFFISCLGIFGLASFMTEQRRKEVGIRKVLGASLNHLNRLLTLDFLKLVLLAIGIASPIAWFLMHNWLADFAYRIEISWWVFVLAAFASLTIAFITVSFRTLKAAMANPVKSLRNE